ncbi:MAG TPA: MFS transporter, partial [Gemmatimonadaceae bacterium]
GGPAGNLLSAGVLAVLGLALGDEAFVDWGWRIAFLASGLLIFVGVWIRTRVEESPIYRDYAARRAERKQHSLASTLAKHWRSVLTVLLVKAGENALFYVFSTFFVVYVTRILRQPRGLALTAAAVASITEVFTIFAAGALSDRVGRRIVTAVGLIASAIWSFALFPLAAQRDVGLTILAVAIGGVCHGIIVGGMSPMFVELFPTSARYTGFSLGYQLATVFAGAVAPIIGVALLNVYGSTVPVSLYAAAMTGPALVCIGMVHETRGEDLSRVE